MRRLPLATIAAVLALPAAAAAQTPVVTTVASGLDSPRHLDIGSDRTIYVAEAGRGGARPCFVGPEGPACFGATGRVTAIPEGGAKRTVVRGLASYAARRTGTNAIGPSGIRVDGDSLLLTTGGPTALTQGRRTISRDDLARQAPAADGFGRLVRVSRNGDVTRIADVWAYEERRNPDRRTGNAALDTNPVDVIRDGSRYVIADAGGNALYGATRRGRMSTFSLFPSFRVPQPDDPTQSILVQSVPTAVDKAPDGSLSASQLTGAPFPSGAAQVFRVPAAGGDPVPLYAGFTNLIDIDYGPDGTLWVLEFDDNGIIAEGGEGALTRIAPDGTRSRVPLPPGTLTQPGGVAAGDDGSVYVTNRSASKGQGSVLQIQQP